MAKIMIVDDDETIRSLFTALIDMMFPDCEVLPASNGEESVALARAIEPDVIFMDINMPGMDGIKATEQIKGFLPSDRVRRYRIEKRRRIGRCMQLHVKTDDVQGTEAIVKNII